MSVSMTPSEIYQSAYGDLAPEIIERARKKQVNNPILDHMRVPDYSEQSMESPVVVRPSTQYDFANAYITKDDLRTINVKPNLYGSGDDVKDKNLSLLMHEIQHSIGEGNTPGTKVIPQKPVDTLDERQMLRFLAESSDPQDLHAVSSAELPAYIAQLKLQRFQDSGKYPSVDTNEELRSHLDELRSKYKQDQYIRDAIEFLNQSPNAVDFWNAVARRNVNLSGLLA